MLAAGGRVRRALAMTIATIGALGAMALVPTPQAVAAEDPDPAIAAIDPVLAADQDLAVEVSVGTEATEDLDVAVLVGARAVATRSSLTQWLDASGSPALARVATATIPAGSSSVQVTVPVADLPWSAATSGAMLLAADVEGVDDRIRSLVTRDLPAGGPTRLALAMSTTTPETDTGLLSADELEAAVTEGGTLAEQLAVGQAGAALGIDPIVPASIAALGDDAPDAAVAWLEAARGLPQTFALPYGGADPVVVARSGVAVPSIAGIPAADGTILPASLAEVPTTIAPVVDATGSALDAALLSTLASGATVIVDTDDLDETLDRETPDAHVTVGGASVLAADAELQSLVRDAVAAGGTESRDGVARVVALLATITREAPALQRTLVAALPDDADPAAALALQEAVASVAWLEQTGIDTALAEPARDGVLVPSEASQAGTDAADRVAALVDAAAITESVATTLADPTTLVAPVRLQLLAAIAATSRADDDAAVARFVELVAPLRAPVSIVEGGETALLGSPAELQVTLENALDVDVTVLLSARTGTNAVTLPEEPIEVVVPASERIRVPMPVDVVAAGSGIVRLDVRTPDGVALDSASLRINAQPAFETILLVVVALAAALLLGFGIVRSIRKRRSGEARGDIDPATEQIAAAAGSDARRATATTTDPGAPA
ncbi:hypothetical protein GCM10009846_30120 [Agrococcus versicolor]|uniref:2-oxoglutarate dehydrogenase n=1 Tax=Agrococcus versicolor TaxID=501482 RepID=A0ABP5MUH9_9MICO